MTIAPLKVAIATVTILAATGCDSATSKLSPATEQRFAAEGFVRRGDDLDFRYTRDAGGRDSRWENRRASIIVTREVGAHSQE